MSAGPRLAAFALALALALGGGAALGAAVSGGDDDRPTTDTTHDRVTGDDHGTGR